jgi:hypothetical protein
MNIKHSSHFIIKYMDVSVSSQHTGNERIAGANKSQIVHEGWGRILLFGSAQPTQKYEAKGGFTGGYAPNGGNLGFPTDDRIFRNEMTENDIRKLPDICVVFVCNKSYFPRFIKTCEQLVTNGKYNGNICLVIGNDLYGDELLNCETIKKNNVMVKHFPDIQFSERFLRIKQNFNESLRVIFQYHKCYLFDVFFKQWDYILYLDCGISIFDDITPIINEACENTLLAHSDAYPDYKWKLHTQFSKYDHVPIELMNNNQFLSTVKTVNSIHSTLCNKYNLDIDYFQTTMMLYDTRIIEDITFNEIMHFVEIYPTSRRNDQGVIALYFTNIKPVFKQIKLKNENTYFYDYLSRNPENKYIMLKQVR